MLPMQQTAPPCGERAMSCFYSFTAFRGARVSCFRRGIRARKRIISTLRLSYRLNPFPCQPAARGQSALYSNELRRDITGQEPTPRPFLNYLEKKLGAIAG